MRDRPHERDVWPFTLPFGKTVPLYYILSLNRKLFFDEMIAVSLLFSVFICGAQPICHMTGTRMSSTRKKKTNNKHKQFHTNNVVINAQWTFRRKNEITITHTFTCNVLVCCMDKHKNCDVFRFSLYSFHFQYPQLEANGYRVSLQAHLMKPRTKS